KRMEKAEISLCARLIRELQDERTPLSGIMEEVLSSGLIEDEMTLKRIERELEGFPHEERGEVEALGRRIKRAGEWEPFFGSIRELERFLEVKREVEAEVFEPGSVMIGEFRPEFLEDREEAESVRAYLRKVRRFLLEAIVEKYFVITERFIRHFEGWL
ncbi:MAG: hypothetical protein DRG36_07030, partial [Deltaproteobacteria bacterium]